MKATPSPQKVIDNPKDFNLTEEYLNDFMDKYREHMKNKNFSNKSFVQNFNGTLNDSTHHQAVNCSEYCDSNMRHVFEDYKEYHGYVTLAVSEMIRFV